MTHGSLFSGIGGFDLAAEWAGFTNIFHCEINPFCRRILKYHFPKVKTYEDITTTDFSKYKGKIDIISGGFPCQPFSCAGKRKGANDDRYLWNEMLRVIEEVRPTWIIGENVTGILSMVQPDKAVRMAKKTDIFFEEYHEIEEQEYTIHQIVRDFECREYNVQIFIIPACAVGAPHRRDRVWIIANTLNTGVKSHPRGKDSICELGTFADTDSTNIKGKYIHEQGKTKFNERDSSKVFFGFEKFPTQPPVCGRDDGLPRKLDAITFPRWRSESVKAYGNAIVPEVAYRIFTAIKEIESNICNQFNN